MDENFDFDRAKSIIDAFISKHGHTERLPAGSMYVTDDVEAASIHVGREDNASSTVFRLFVSEDGSEDEKELTLYTVAVLAQKLLPPFKPKRKYAQGRQALFASFRQSVTLHGAVSEVISNTIHAVKYAYVLLDPHAVKSAPFPIERVCTDNLVVWNPYFTVGSDAHAKESVPFSKLVDPFDNLNRVLADDCVHASDNEVQYMRGFEDEQGRFRIAPISPSRFRPGNIVRVGFAVCLKQDNKSDGASELTLVLRSVTLVDDSMSKDLALKRLNDTVVHGKKRANVSRGLLVPDEEERPVVKIRKAMADLAIDGADMEVEGNGGSA